HLAGKTDHDKITNADLLLFLHDPHSIATRMVAIRTNILPAADQKKSGMPLTRGSLKSKTCQNNSSKLFETFYSSFSRWIRATQS
ncbi:MAG: hypothetical protein ACLFQ6_11445, partial [Candidatus Sumerlaeia bacterium]